MGKILVIAEKPSVARDIAKVLKAGQKGDGCLIGEEYVVSWAIGHLVTLAEPYLYTDSFFLVGFFQYHNGSDSTKFKVCLGQKTITTEFMSL